MGKFWRGKILVNELHVQLQLIIKGSIWRVKIGERYSICRILQFFPLQNFPTYSILDCNIIRMKDSMFLQTLGICAA